MMAIALISRAGLHAVPACMPDLLGILFLAIPVIYIPNYSGYLEK